MDAPSSNPPGKREVMLALLDRAEARVHLDARRPGVVLPPPLRGEGHVLLDYGYRFTPPIPDLSLDDDGIRATLSFSRQPFSTFVPWSAVYLIADFDGNGAVWQEDIPADLLEAAEAAMKAEQNAPLSQKNEAARDATPVPAPKKKGARPSHLKLVP